MQLERSLRGLAIGVNSESIPDDMGVYGGLSVSCKATRAFVTCRDSRNEYTDRRVTVRTLQYPNPRR